PRGAAGVLRQSGWHRALSQARLCLSLSLSLPFPAGGWPGMNITLVVACALVDADRRVLIAQRPQGKQLAGLWEFPGGKIEPGETPEAALIRELAEELGVETQQACLAPLTFASHGYADWHLLMPLYVCRK